MTARRVQVTTGAGPWECRRFASLLVAALVAECEARGLTVLSTDVHGDPSAPSSVVISVRGDVDEELRDWIGTHELRAHSPRRAKGSRSRWYVGVRTFDDTARTRAAKVETGRFVLRADRAGGPGGQNVNRRATAVRARDEATGLQVRVTDQRTQGANRKIAIERLAERVEERRRSRSQESDRDERASHGSLIRGRPCRHWRLDARDQLVDVTDEDGAPRSSAARR